MPSATNSYAFYADYGSVAKCLFAIQTSEAGGAFATDAEISRLLRLFEKDVLRKLYLRTIKILGVLEGFEGTEQKHIIGDFEDDFFVELDFYLGYLDTRNTGYSSMFQTVLNIFKELVKRRSEISEEDKWTLDSALIPVLDAFESLQEYLIKAGLNPCAAPDSMYQNNTPGVYLQAAGADGANGIAEGIHLRWSLTDELGANHLPKGNYHNNLPSSSGYNQPDDYVHISRTPYLNTVRMAVDFSALKPIVDFGTKRWSYLIEATFNDQQLGNRVRLTFKDAALFDQLTATVPVLSPFEFLKRYNGLLELEVVNKAAFAIGFDFGKDTASGNANIKIEAVCKANVWDASAEAINIRKTLVLDTNASSTFIYGENIRRVRLKKSAEGRLKAFYFETYDDFLGTRNQSDWLELGSGFGLSTLDQDVFDRLESANYPIDNLWPQYNEGTKVKVANYKDKWAVSRPGEPSLKEAVKRYLSLSETDPRAEDILKADGAKAEDPGLLISYLDVLNLQSLDYHMARMLGLGYIDTLTAGPTEQFIYRLSYKNRKSLSSAAPTNYTYTSLPRAKSDQLLPEKPEMRPLSYQLPVVDRQVNTMFDEHGYTKMDNIRIVNIGRTAFKDELLDHDFFSDLISPENQNVFEHPKPVMYGVKYRPASRNTYVKPEITAEKALGTVYYAYDQDHPATGIPETVPVPDDETSLYIHFEHQTGVHFYAIYGINWFARTSVISDEMATDATAFPLKNSFLPPTDVAVQYIQKEEPLLLTTSLEQAWLKGRTETFPGLDINFTRLTFSWMDIEDVSRFDALTVEELQKVIRPDKIKAFFKPSLPLEVIGIIRNMVPVSNSDTLLKLYTGSYQLMDRTTISPTIAPEDLFKFADSLLSTPNGQFRVIGIEQGADWPIITIEKAYDAKTIEDPAEPGSYATQKDYLWPEVNSRFTMVENLSRSANWAPIAENISLLSFADINQPKIESVPDSEGNISKFWVGGINGNATVTPLFSDAQAPEDLPGYYKISYDPSVSLAAHPQVNIPFDAAVPAKNAPDALHQAHVEWYKGWVRIPLKAGGHDKKLLQVLRIEQLSPLVLYTRDATYTDSPILDSISAIGPVDVNFHPGYRAYLFPEPAPNHTFNGSNILPPEDSNDRKTLIGLQSVDTRVGGSGFVSDVSVPSVLLARNIVEPVQFEAPLAPGLKVRPDATGKAAFTFDIRIAPNANGQMRKPFGFAFYRTTHEDVLDALYSPQTVKQIFIDLKAIETDPFYNLRLYELVNLIFDPAHPLQFKVFEAQPTPYGFPVPDKVGLTKSNDSNAVKIAKYRKAIQTTLLPLAEQTPIFSFIKQGYETENRLPVIKDLDGNLLSNLDPNFNPFPMARKYTKAAEPKTTYVRFTDYLLNASSRNLYFYAGTELTNQLVPGPMSLFAGPVSILQTAAAEMPLLTTFAVQPAAVQGDRPVVRFQLAPFSSGEYITKIRVYRTTDPLKVVALSLMDTHFDVKPDAGAWEGYEIVDDFADMVAIPSGETLYYRFVGIRTILNEKEEAEEVFSFGTEALEVRLIDTVNPNAPGLTYDAASNSLNWLPTTNNGTYYLYRQNIRGNWQRIHTLEPPVSSKGMQYTFAEPLPLDDGAGNRIYHRFKVQVRNSSGLFNLSEKEITI